jgi:uncharacterized membrane protein
MLVHFPIVFWSCALAADIVGVFTPTLLVAGLASGSLALGCAMGLLAMIAGAFDFVALPQDSPARDAAVLHFMAMCSAWLIFVVALALHGYPPKPPAIAALLATVVGFLTMAYGARLGGKLVYEFGVGKSPVR